MSAWGFDVAVVHDGNAAWECLSANPPPSLAIVDWEMPLPICSYCKRIRNDQNYWERVEVYVTEHTDAKFTHGICPTCLEAAKAEFEKEDAVSEPPRGRT